MVNRYFLVLLLVVFLPRVCNAAEQKAASAPSQTNVQTPTADTKKEQEPEKTSSTHHVIRIKGGAINYTATAGRITLREESGKARGDIFFTAYVMDQPAEKSKRPVTFAFNGGPGASSVWLHMGAIGPKRVMTEDLGGASAPPYTMGDNEYSWLPFTDLVFIDPVGTGYSRPAQGENSKQFYGIKEDIESVGEFIRLYATRYDRWVSPKFIVGESYGTFRAIGLSDYLYDSFGMDLNGLMLISLAIDFQSFSYNLGNDLPYTLFLPSYACSAWYHKRLDPDLQENFEKTRNEAEEWALHDYSSALLQGDALTDVQKGKTIEGLLRFTGLPKSYLENTNLRVNRSGFMNELLRSDDLSLGLMDGRKVRRGRSGDFLSDPGMVGTLAPYVAVLNDYFKNELKYETDLAYVFLSEEANGQWNWGSGLRGYPSVLEKLQKVMRRSTHLKILTAGGYFDLDTPYFGIKYAMNHLGLDASLRANIRMGFYEGGHMLYTNVRAIEKLTADVAGFVADAIPARK